MVILNLRVWIIKMSICKCECCEKTINLDYEDVSTSEDGMSFLCEGCSEVDDE